jgi:hypothetical protein
MGMKLDFNLKEEHRLRVSEQGAEKNVWTSVRGTAGRMQEITEELHNLYSSTNMIYVSKSKKMRWVGHVARI